METPDLSVESPFFLISVMRHPADAITSKIIENNLENCKIVFIFAETKTL